MNILNSGILEVCPGPCQSFWYFCSWDLWELDLLDKHSKILSGLELEMTQSAPPVEQIQWCWPLSQSNVGLVTTKQENVAILSHSFMSHCSMTSEGMFFVGQTFSTSAKLCFVLISELVMLKSVKINVWIQTLWEQFWQSWYKTKFRFGDFFTFLHIISYLWMWHMIQQ